MTSDVTRTPVPGHPGVTLRNWIDARGKVRRRFDAAYRDPARRERSRTFDRLSDADRWLREQRTRMDHGAWIDPTAGRTTFAAFAAQWAEGAGHLAPHTRRRYESLLARHILPRIGDLPMNQIRHADVRAIVSTMQAADLAPKTIRHAATLLSGILRAAQRDGLIVRLPTDSLGLPRLQHVEQRVLTHDDVARLAATEPLAPRYRALVLLGAYGALRWGELAGLRISRLRLLERKVDVVETDQGRAPKWGSAGTVTIPRFVADELGAHLAAFPPGPDGFVFSMPGGGPLRYANWYRRSWRPAIEAAGLAPLRPHDLRHTAVALAIAAGAHPKEIQELCRHRSITTTLNTYGHLFPQLHERLADRLDAAFLEACAGSMRDGSPASVTELRSEAL